MVIFSESGPLGTIVNLGIAMVPSKNIQVDGIWMFLDKAQGQISLQADLFRTGS
jgi:hypothetical protein